MKTKPTQNHESDIEEDDEDSGAVEVNSGNPTISSIKQNKFIIIGASAVLITIVLYFLFFRSSENKNEVLEVVENQKASPIESSKESPFEFEVEDKKAKEDTDLLAKPNVPDLPVLPDLPKDFLPPEEIVLPKENNPANKPEDQRPAPIIPAQEQNQNQVVAQNNQAQEVNEKPKEERKPVDPRYAPIVVFSGPSNTQSVARGVGYEKNIIPLKGNNISDLEKTKSTTTATYIADRTNVISQGKLINAVLETAINTEAPGFARAIVSRDVYGESGLEVLIPKGSRLFGSYSSEIIRGQGRVKISWSRLIRNDGVDLAINFNASDQFGRSGISGDVDNKYGSIISSSLLTSMLAVAGVAVAEQLMGNNNQTTTTINPSMGSTTIAGPATTQAIADVTRTIVNTVSQVLNNSINVTPVIRVPQGTRITVIVNGDIKIPSSNKK